MAAVLDGLKFLGQSFRNGATVGAVWPSSKGLCEAMVRPVVGGAAGPLRVLEVGAGVGPVTAELIRRLLPGDHLDVVELNPEFCATLRKRFSGIGELPLSIHEADILQFEPGVRYHHIVSGLPLANFPAELSEAIYKRFFELLEPDGTLIMFHHILGREALRFFGTPKDRRRAKRLMEIEEQLAPLVVGSHTVMLNVPPARVLVRRRPGAGHDREAS
jgi:16S rRNA A1518/A1519 N6-dimethyltransferase RsmA/KsgA/DIM1 with predicted DNA glycosylase/AP lyase activity